MKHLEESTTNEKQRQILSAICKLHDPIGLATKPLFLQMIKETMNGLSDPIKLPSDLNEMRLYESYVDQALRRKIRFLEDDQAGVLLSEILQNLTKRI
jgi:hypothetical protein